MTIIFSDIDDGNLVEVSGGYRLRGVPPYYQRVSVAGLQHRGRILTNISISEDIALSMDISPGDRVKVSRVKNKEHVIVLQKTLTGDGTWKVQRHRTARQLHVRVPSILNSKQSTYEVKIVGVKSGALALDISM
jgi:hypothetical protein